ncbi:GTPase HflX [Aneurinibacillus sp. Ricciae_BoGa-3]|uniref:GTPase HflX n=1 Tax=Aneurinibacillus sp. Ricciae_BoGa-3 TaxID=3022697 RepID=UPI002341744F|nr:GTPase HflX [Aneurinibacillus sp. Ricciae_BoGa-3]WCK52384.1 GTPase HflX [Aneurinibacillus sp. Ricciae_BoGa-3]
MIFIHTIEQNQPERAVLVGYYKKNSSQRRFELSLEELKELTYTAQAEVVAVLTQGRDLADSRWYVGKGKVEEINQVVQQLNANLVIFNDELTPMQIRNLEQAIDCRVVDRTQLILDIFAQRAQSREGKLQVELAQLKYRLPRLTGKGAELSRLGAGIGTRGPGETKLESDRRHIRRRIGEIEAHIEEVKRHRRLHRERRKKNEAFQVSIVGYTNAGKSTILNRLTDAGILEEDKLFATLDPTSRRVELPGGQEIIMTDTVGFIQDLPHQLVAAFRSTLEEAAEADLLLHVIDASNPDYSVHMEVVDSILEDLEAQSIPRITVFNKMDKMGEKPVASVAGEVIYVSANKDEDMKKLLAAVQAHMEELNARYLLHIPVQRGDLRALVHRSAYVEEETITEDGMFYDLLVKSRSLEQISPELKHFMV